MLSVPHSSVTLPSVFFAAALTTLFFLGGCIGYLLGKRRRENPPVGSAHDVHAKGRSSRRRRRRRRRSSDEIDKGEQIKSDRGEEEEEDGPTIVLRGSLDLLASKWGIMEDLGSSTATSTKTFEGDDNNQSGGGTGTNLDTTNPSPLSSSAVVEYLSPEEMTQLLFSNIHRDGADISRTLCLDEHHSNSSQNSNGPPTTGEVPSARSSAINMSNLLPSPKRNIESNDDYKSSSTSSSVITPKSFVNLLHLIQKYSVNTSHPYFFNQLFGSLDPIALAAEIVALSVNTSVYTYETAPVFTLLEREVMGQIGKLVFHNGENNIEDDGDGLEKNGEKHGGEEEREFEGEGLMIPGGSLANLTAMHAARHRWKVMNGYTANGTTELDEESRRLMLEEDQMEDQLHYWSSEENGEEEKKLEDISSHGASPTVPAPPRQQQPTTNGLYNNDRSSPDLVAFVSSEAHYSFTKSARVLGLREDDLIVVPTHADGRMDVTALAKRIEELECDSLDAPSTARNRRRNTRRRVPFFVACTAGSTVRGSFDDIADIVRVCRCYESRGDDDDDGNERQLGQERSIWVHVDGAWGGSAIFSSRPSIRRATRVDQVGLADSFTFNPHKMLGAPQQTTAFIVRHRRALRDSNAAGAKYLFDSRKNGAEYDLGDLSYTCGRRTDAVKLWALWKYYGRKGLGRRVDQKVDQLEAFVEEVRRRGRADGSFALACKPWLFNVNFFYFPPRIRRILEARGIATTRATHDNDAVNEGESENDDFIEIPDDIAQDMSNVSVLLKLRLHEAGEMIIPYQPLNNQKADCFRLVLAGKKDIGINDIRHILDTMDKYGNDL
eukprot:CAMPEP_0201660456 /NCGR_PEP_ID=MMETSP0494-20130426/3090_1 /ASSEMBLY_ACC=CAM_ASM_000839 /TAXON_ID=420259 /ORGANISM="Thalassiosira gravida, Strain GMp14c1" /LENGTH=833 /DNA_ID=CAMNT_0048138333 /DNA_START=239 /DNA_END=2740 /DNA_ORIENTATION=-